MWYTVQLNCSSTFCLCRAEQFHRLIVLLCFSVIAFIFQAVKNVLSMSEKEMSKQNNVEKFDIREQNKNKTEAKWKYKVSLPELLF